MHIKWLLWALPCILFAESPFFLLQKKRPEEPSNAPKIYAEAPSPSEPSRFSQFRTDISFLIWQAQEDGLEFAARNTPGFPPTATIPTDISASLSSLDFAWEPAFKLLLGYSFSHPAWELNARWTWFYTRSSRSVSESLSSAGAGVFSLWIPPQAALSTYPVYSRAKGTLHLLLNNFDIELGAENALSRLFALKLYGGLKILTIDQTFRTKYTGGYFDETHQMLDANAVAKARCYGMGPRLGFGSKWTLPHGLSLIAEAAGALTLSDIRTKRKDNDIGSTMGAIQEITVRYHENFWIWLPLVEGKVGIDWEHCFGHLQNRVLHLNLAYEIQEYWEQNTFTRYTDAAIFYGAFNNRGNLTLQGFSLTATLGY